MYMYMVCDVDVYALDSMAEVPGFVRRCAAAGLSLGTPLPGEVAR